jgi:hypothetical protein
VLNEAINDAHGPVESARRGWADRVVLEGPVPALDLAV